MEHKDLTEMQKLAATLGDNDAIEVAEMINTVHSEVIGINKKNYIPEIVFKESFLGFFKTMNNTNLDDPIARMWVNFSGSPYSEVDVIDKQGNVIYTVPGLLSKPNVDAALGKNVNFDRIASTYELKHNRLPEVGSNYLNSELGAVQQYISADTETAAGRWAQIFKRYDNAQNETLTPFANSKAKSDDKIDLVYD